MTRTEFQELLDKAKEMTTIRLANFPAYGVFIHASEQLELIETILKRSKVPTDSERDAIDIGLMAVKELESTDPDYARILEEVEDYFSTLVGDL